MADLYRRWAWALRVAGHPYVYTTHAAWDLTAANALWPEGTATPKIYACLQPPGLISGDTPLIGGLSNEGGIDLELTTDPDFVETGDPTDSISRLGPRSCTGWGLSTGFVLDPDGDAIYTAGITTSDDPDFFILLDRSYGGPIPGIIHVGSETMYATEAGGLQPDPAELDPYYVRVEARGIGGTIRQRHTAQLVTLDQPIVAGPQIPTWRSRLAVLLRADISADGSLGAQVEVLQGFIEQTPRSRDGITFSLSLSPLTAFLRTELPSAISETRLARDVHLHTRGVADYIHAAEWLTRTVWEGVTRDSTIADSELLDLYEANLQVWLNTFDFNIDDNHPRGGAISIIYGEAESVHGVTGTATEGGGPLPNQLTLADGPLNDVPIGTDLVPRFLRRREAGGRFAFLLPAFDPATPEFTRWLRWPGDPNDDVNSAAGILNSKWVVDSHTGDDGGWISVRLDGAQAVAQVTTGADCVLYVPGVENPEPPEDGPLRVWQLDDAGDAVRQDWPRFQNRLYRGVTAAIGADRDADGLIKIQGLARDTRTTPFRLARAWCQRGEPWIIVEDQIDVSSGRIEIQNTRGANGARSFVPLRVDPVIEEVVVPEIGGEREGDILYKITILDPENLPSLADFGDFDEGIVVRTAPRAYQSSGELLSYLLTDPTHLNFGSEVVDVQSMLAQGSDPTWVQSWRLPETDEPLIYEEIIDGILRLTRSTIVMSTSRDGKNRMTRVTLGGESLAKVRGEITAGDWIADSVPTWSSDDRLINALSIRADFGRIYDGEETEYDYRYTASYQSRTSQRVFGETRGEDIDVSAAGRIDRDLPSIDSIGQSILGLYDSPRRIWEGEISTAQALDLPLGSTVRVTSPHLRGYGPDPVVARLGVVVERQISLGEEGARIKILHFGTRSTGWNAAALIVQAESPTQVLVTSNSYSSLNSPVTGLPQRDLDYFEVGDVVYVVPEADHDAGVVRIITDIDRDNFLVTFNAPHGAGLGAAIVPAGHNLGSEIHRQLAYLADDDGLLDAPGGGTVPGLELE